MASLWKHPQSRFYTACFTDINGKRRKQSSKETDKRKAQKLADQYEAAARRKQTAMQVRRVISNLHKQIRHEDVAFLSVRAFATKWLESKKPMGAVDIRVLFEQGDSVPGVAGAKADKIAEIQARRHGFPKRAFQNSHREDGEVLHQRRSGDIQRGPGESPDFRRPHRVRAKRLPSPSWRAAGVHSPSTSSRPSWPNVSGWRRSRRAREASGRAW